MIRIRKTASQLVPLATTGYSAAVNARDELLASPVEHISPQDLAGFQASEAARQRVWALVAKEKETGLLPEEKLELDDYMELEHLLVLAKAKARLNLSHG